MSDLIVAPLAVAFLAAVAALLVARAERWGWAVAAGMVSAAVMVPGPAATGGALLLGVALATLVEVPTHAPGMDFNGTLGRLAALLLGVFGALVVVVRALSLDAGQNIQVLLLVAVGMVALLFLLVYPSPTQGSRAARMVVVVAAAGWALTGHPGIAAALATAVLMVLLALAPRLLVEVA